MIQTSPLAWAATSFTDVDEKAWYHAAVEETVTAGLLSGTSATTFSPSWGVTRAMAVTVLWRLAGTPEGKNDGSFSDVPDGMWYTQAVAWAKESGITAGNDKGLFQPGDYVTREQMAVFLYQYARINQLDTAKGKVELYSDASSISKWAKSGMEHALGAGLIVGSGGKLQPKRITTRAELAVILERLMTPAMG